MAVLRKASFHLDSVLFTDANVFQEFPLGASSF